MNRSKHYLNDICSVAELFQQEKNQVIETKEYIKIAMSKIVSLVRILPQSRHHRSEHVRAICQCQ